MEKLFFVACFVSALTLTLANLHISDNNILGDEGVHNLEDCPYPANATFALCSTEVHEEGKWFTTLTRDVTCPTTGVNIFPIMCIRAVNADGESHGGYAKVLTGGGVGFFSTTIRLTSQNGRGLNFRVEVYTNKNVTSSAVEY